jgi:hypothetical protein
MTRLRDLRGPLVLGALLAVAGWAFYSFVHVFAGWLLGDARQYETWGNLVTNHAVPYRDFDVEYPPGALPAFVVPVYLRKLAGYHGTYFDWLRAELLVLQLGCLVAMALALVRLGASRRRAYLALAAAGGGSGILGPIAYFHYDWWPAFLAVAALAALLAGRGVAACALAAVGAAAKVFPVLLVPFALAELWRRARWRGVGVGTAAAAGVLAAIVVPFAVVAPHGLGWALHRELRRPLEVESIGTSFFVVAHHVAGYGLHAVWIARSRNLDSPAAHAVVQLLGVLTAVSLVAIFVLWLRSSRGPEELVLAVCAAAVAYVVFSKVFSPQYLIWLLVLVPLLGGRLGARATGLLLAICGVTQIFEPYRWQQYWHFATPWLDWVVVARNALVLALLALLAEPLVRAARAPEPERVPALQPE